MTLVIDASVVVDAFLGVGPNARWAESLLLSDEIAAPHLVLAEAANIFRRRALAGDISYDAATRAHADLPQLQIVLYDYHSVAERIWELRGNVTVYDAWYIALAEALDASLATLDERLARTPGARCPFVTPGP